jgi:hypothetical protein
MGILSFLGDIAGAIPGIGTAVKVGTGILGAVTGAKKGANADKLNAQQLALAKGRYDAGAPFRSKLAETAFGLPTQREDLFSIFADPGNPYARLAPRPGPVPLGGGSPIPPTATPRAPRPRRPSFPMSPQMPIMGAAKSDKARSILDAIRGMQNRGPGMIR